jgi:hypothetical protein
LLGVSASSPNLCGVPRDFQGGQRVRCLHGACFRIHAVYPAPRTRSLSIHQSRPFSFSVLVYECVPFLACRFRLSATKILICHGRWCLFGPDDSCLVASLTRKRLQTASRRLVFPSACWRSKPFAPHIRLSTTQGG